MAHKFEVYIDESGCEGFKFRDHPEPGSPQWFVLSAVIWPSYRRSEVLNHIRDEQKLIAPKRKHLHFTDLSHEQRVAWINSIANSKAKCINVCIFKPGLQRPEIFKPKDRLYFYATRLLLERVSWYCRDTPVPGGGSLAKIHFSKRKNMSYDDLNEYLDTLREQNRVDAWTNMLLHDVRIFWGAVNKEHIEVQPHNSLLGLQMADAVCASFRMALEFNKHLMTEHRYAKIAKPCVVHRGNNYQSYGLKFFPNPPQEEDEKPNRYNWIRKYYNA